MMTISLIPAPSDDSPAPASSATTVELTPSEREATFEALRDLPSVLHMPAFLEAIWPRLGAVARPVVRGLLALEQPGSAGILVIRGLPVDPPSAMPSSPVDGRRPPGKRSSISEGVLASLALIAGHPIRYFVEKQGAVIHDLAPVPGAEHENFNGGSRVPQKGHIDLGPSATPPDLTALFCLRGDPRHQALTWATSIDDVLPVLTERQIGLLRQPIFSIRYPRSVEREIGREIWSKPLALLDGPDDHVRWRISIGDVRTLAPLGHKALEALEAAIADAPKSHVDLQEGDCLVLANRFTIHGRTPYEPSFEDGKHRWLQRIYVRTGVVPGCQIEDGLMS